MPAVFVHGVPETPAIWAPLVDALGRDDVVCLPLPGFGCPRPDGFGAGKDEYVGWLAGELERLRADGPIDLVGHDWGGGFTARVVSLHPDLVRSWVTDAAGLAHPDHEWHGFATLWQTPGAGEEFFEQQLAAQAGNPSGPFASLDATMAACILDLYRSAVHVGREWAPRFRDVAAPGLVLVPLDDPFLSPDVARAAAAQAGASVHELRGRGHWWMQEDAVGAAEVLRTFWASLG